MSNNKIAAGGEFVLDIPAETPAVWGHGHDVLWAKGESLLICGGNGVGKTTLAGQLLRARIGLTDNVLGLPVETGQRRVLYLAMDRPAQVRRSLHRQFGDGDRGVLNDRLAVWKGPPPEDLAKYPDLLRKMATDADADTVIVDSLKDAAVGLTDDAVAAGWNRARQGALAADVELLELHHLTKRNANGGEADSIRDVYGSAWITAGSGSAILLKGDPGDPVVELRHLKQPDETVGPWQLLHDHDRGVTAVMNGSDPLEVLRSRGQVTAAELAVVMSSTDKPTTNEIEKARRQLDRLVTVNLATKITGGRGGGRDRSPSVFVAASAQGELI